MTTASPPADEPTPSAPETPLTELTDDLDSVGFEGQFRPEPGGLVECLTCRHRVPADEVENHEMTRLEGESDPADMAIVVAIRCPACGAHGTLILNYGPDASAEEADVLTQLDRPNA